MILLNRYLYAQTIRGLALAFVIIASLVVLVDFVELSRRFGSYDQVTALTIAYMTALKMPSVIEQTLPFIVLFGIMWSMFRLNRRSELIAMRAAGYSAWSFAAPPTVIAVTLGIFAITVLNPGVAVLNSKFEEKRVQISRTAGATITSNENNIWLREAVPDGSLIIHAKSASARDAILLNVSFFYYQLDVNEKPVFLKRIDAKRAELIPGAWVLWDASEVKKNSLPERIDKLQVKTNYDVNSLLEHLSDDSAFSFWELPRIINNSKAAKLDSRRYEIQWNRMLALPLTLAAMALIGASFSFRLVRLGGVFGMAVIGASIGFFLYFTGDLLAALGSTKVLPPIIAAWAAPAFVFFTGLARITIVEDG
ncbi:LPS export ABC transporter permease LptG [Oceanicaulis sp. AH-315-P02]|nr:LPS export ABC transporter permease LptG [Oceanicaulis sp. AH-315-P02]